MLRITMIRLKRAWSLALSLRNRGDARHPGRLQRLPAARAAQKSTYSRKENECQKCKQIIDYLFSPLRTSEEIRRIQSIIIEDIKRLQRSLSENSVENRDCNNYVCGKPDKCVRCQRIIDQIFGEEKPVTDNIMITKAKEEIICSEKKAPSRTIENPAFLFSKKAGQVASDLALTQNAPVHDTNTLIATTKNQIDPVNLIKNETPIVPSSEGGAFLATTPKQLEPVKQDIPKTPIPNTENLLAAAAKHLDPVQVATIDMPFSDTSNLPTYAIKADPGTLMATTAKQTEEQLAQKVEAIDETPLVEAENPKLTGFNTLPRVLGDKEKDLYIAPEIEIDRETVIRDNVRHTFEKIVRRLENTELLAGITPLQCSVVNCVSGGANPGGKPPDKFGDSSDNQNKSEQNKYDKIAKQFLSTPNSQIDARLIKQMKQLGVPDAAGKKSSIEVRSSKSNKQRKPSEKSILELDARKSEDNAASEEKQLKEISRVANFQSDLENKSTQKTECGPLLDKQFKEKPQVVTFISNPASIDRKLTQKSENDSAKQLEEKPAVTNIASNPNSKIESDLLSQGIRYTEETTPDAVSFKHGNKLALDSFKITDEKADQLFKAKRSMEPNLASDENAKIKLNPFSSCTQEKETKPLSFDQPYYKELSDKADLALTAKSSKPLDRTYEEHKNEAMKHLAYDKLPDKEPVFKVDQVQTIQTENSSNNELSEKTAHSEKSHILISPAEPASEERPVKSASKHLNPWTTKHPYYRELSHMKPESEHKKEIRGQNILQHSSQEPELVKDISVRPPYDAHKPLESLDSRQLAAEEDALNNYIVFSKKHKKNAMENKTIKESLVENRTPITDSPPIKHIATDPKGSGYTTEQDVNYVVNAQKQLSRKTTTGETLQSLNQTLREIQKRPMYDAHKPILKLTVRDEPIVASPKEDVPATEQSVYYTVEDKNKSRHDHQKLFKQMQHMREAQNWSSRQFLNYRKDKLLSNPTVANDHFHEEHHQRRLQKRKRKTFRKMPAYYPQVSPQMLFYPNYQEPPFPFPETSSPSRNKIDPFPGQPSNQRNEWPKAFEDRPQQFIPYAPDPTNPEAFKQHALAALYTEERKPIFDPNKPILNPYEKDYYKKHANKDLETADDQSQNVVENYTEPASNQPPSSYPVATPQMYYCPGGQTPHFNQFGQFAGQWVNRNVWSKTPETNQEENFNANEQTFSNSPFHQNALTHYLGENKPEHEYTNVAVTETPEKSDANSAPKTESTAHSGFTYHIPNSWLDQYPYSQEQMAFFQQQTPHRHHQTHMFNASQNQWSQNQYMQNQIPEKEQNYGDQESDPQMFPRQIPHFWARQPYYPGQQPGFYKQRFSQFQFDKYSRYFNANQNPTEEPEVAPQNYNPYNMQYPGQHMNYQPPENSEEGTVSDNIPPQGTVRARPVEQLQGALYTAGKGYENETPAQFPFPQTHDQWMGNQFPYFQDTPMGHQMRFESSDQTEGMGSGRTLENMERRPPYDPHRPLANQRGAESNAEAEEDESNENAGQPWMNQFPGAYPGVTPHGMFYPNASPDVTQQPDPQHPYFHQNFTPYANAGQLQQNEWVHPFSPPGQLQQYDENSSDQKQSEEEEEGLSPGEKTPIQATQMRPDLNNPKGPNAPPPGPAAAFISLPQGEWKTATLSPEKDSLSFDAIITPLPESVPLDVSLPLSEILRRVRKRSRLEYIAKWTQMDDVQGKCGRERPPCPPPQPVCPKAEPTPPPPCPPPPPPCPRPCKPKCPPPCIPPTPGCPPCCKFESVSLGDTLYHLITLLWDFGLTRLHRRSLADARCVTQTASATKSVMTDEEIPIEVVGENQYTTYGSNLGSYCWKLETLALARGFEPWVPMPSWPLPVKQEKKKLVCPKEGCKTPPPPRHGTKCERPCYPGNPCMGFPNTYRKS